MQGYAVDCCVDNHTSFSCTEGADLSGSCPEPPNQYVPGALCAAVAQCHLGCCCAQPSAPNPDEWNLNQNNLLMNALECSSLGNDYQYNTMPPDGDCVSVCADVSGGGGGPSADRHTVSGTILESDSTPIEDATVYIPFIDSALQATSEADGGFTIANVPEMQGFLIATKLGCEPVSSPIIVDETTQPVELRLNCGAGACVPASNPTITATPVRGTDEARLTFTADNTCGNRLHYSVVRFEVRPDGTTASEVIGPITSDEYFDEGLLPQTNYCYKVAAYYEGPGLYPASIVERDEACLTTGVAECMNNPEIEWCDNEADPSVVLSCNDDNTLDESRQCASGQICGWLGDRYDCIDKPPCEQCNGLFGMLKNLVFSIFHNGVAKACDSSALENFCFEDKSRTIVDTYKTCGEVNVCEDYRSLGSCSNNPCAIQANCEWKEVLDELGKGVCQSADKPAACSTCEGVFGFCNQELCEAIGDNNDGTSDCYYDGQDNGLDYTGVTSRCVHRDEMACRYYDVRNDCGTQGVAIDVTYAGDERVAGTHSLITQSNDKFGLGLCDWQSVPTDPAGGRCYKDADGITQPDPDDDCIENGVFANRGHDCLRDSKAPVTQLVIPAATIGAHEVASLDFTITDNYYSSQELDRNTWFCLRDLTAGEDCYPTLTLGEMVAQIPDMEIGEQRPFGIKYYSIDRSGNLEAVKEEQVTIIELGYPRLENAELRGE